MKNYKILKTIKSWFFGLMVCCLMMLFCVVVSNPSYSQNAGSKNREAVQAEDKTSQLNDDEPKPKDIKARLVFKSKNLTKDEREVVALAEKIREKPLDGEWWSKSEAISYNLDSKGRKEVFYSGSSNFDCGSAGCLMQLYQYKNKNWQIVQSFRTVGDVLILNNKTNGFYDISMGIKYMKKMSPDKNKKLKITQEELQNGSDWTFDWKNCILHWNKKYYCAETFKNC